MTRLFFCLAYLRLITQFLIEITLKLKADFIQDNEDNWLVLEVGTDGIFNYVDRNIGNKALEAEISENIARAFWSKLSSA